MRAGERLALAIVIGIVVLVGGAAGAATYAWRSSGTVTIAVHEAGPDGTDVNLRVPGLLLDAAIAFLPTPTIDEAEFAFEALEAVAHQLATMPDAVLVDVREGGSAVRIEKIDGRLAIHVHEPGESVDIDLPVSSIRRLAAKLGRAARVRAAA